MERLKHYLQRGDRVSIKIRPRKEWGARRPRSGRARQNPGMEHGSTAHINTPAEERAHLRETQNFHMDDPDRRWADIGYNYAAFQSGRIYRLRGIEWVPAAQLLHNTNTVAVTCILGPDDVPSDALKLSLRRLKDNLDRKAGRDLTVRPHHAVTSTSCPGPRLTEVARTLNRH